MNVERKDEIARHISFLREEVEGNEFFQSDRFGLNELALQEFVDTIFEPSFEGRPPTHGTILCSHPFDEYQQNLPPCTWLPGIQSDGRIFCDGIKTFRIICKDIQGVVSFSDKVVFDELDLFTIRDDALYNFGGEEHHVPLTKDMWLIKRNARGEITFLCEDGIAVHRDARISFFKYQYHFKRQLSDYISNRWPENPWPKQLLDSILRIAIHTLGADAGVGGTIVLYHPDDDPDNYINSTNAMKLPDNLKVTLRDHQSLLVTLMRYTDGAVLVDSEGRVRSARNWLVVPTEIMSEAGSEGGTRHLTAKLFSKSIQGLVFVISSDGPVSLFAQGERVFRTCIRR